MRVVRVQGGDANTPWCLPGKGDFLSGMRCGVSMAIPPDGILMPALAGSHTPHSTLLFGLQHPGRRLRFKQSMFLN